ncbi:tetratricopeptide repeat protein [Cellulophaga omnivescoria]|uniref:tetratricopeptide repeat protein n=1 Tax=Cellulophaga omnivescoria TaxID=1888890 RepID=UPI0009858AA6|nr:tetratricopeptide repeat protein [Cellulophaga omnivescoria]
MRHFKFINIIILGIVLFSEGCFSQKPKDSIHYSQLITELNYKYYQNIHKNPIKSLEYARKAYEFRSKIESELIQFKIKLNFATALFINEKYIEALDVLNKIEDNKLPLKSKALLFTLKGLIENDLNQFTEAEYHYKLALNLYKKLKDKDNQFAILNNLGILYNNIGEYKRSSELYLDCYELIPHLTTKIDLYKYYMNTGIVSFNLNDNKKAEELFSRALDEAKKNGDSLRIFKTQDKLAEVNQLLKKLNIALEYHKRALDGYQRLCLKKEQSKTLLKIGKIYTLKKNQDSSLYYYKSSKKIALEFSYKQEELEASLSLGQYFQKNQKFKEARTAYIGILKNDSSIVNNKILKNTYFNLSQIEKQSNNRSKAFQYLEEYFKYDKILRNQHFVSLNEQKEVQQKLLKKEYELEKLHSINNITALQLKNKSQQLKSLVISSILVLCITILLLTLYLQKRRAETRLAIQHKKLINSNKEIKENRSELIRINQIKDQLLSIVAHDVKSPITNLKNLLFILRNNFDSLSNKEIKSNLSIIESNSNNLLHNLNNILNWIITQTSGTHIKLSTFSLNKLIKSNLKLIESTIYVKDLIIHFHPDKSNNKIKSDKNIVDLALRNLLSNAVKFSHKNEKIIIEIKRISEHLIEIHVTDFGIGLHKDAENIWLKKLENIPNSKGTNNEKGYGIGLSLCQKMLSKVNSRILYKKNEPVGSIFIIQLTNF